MNHNLTLRQQLILGLCGLAVLFIALIVRELRRKHPFTDPHRGCECRKEALEIKINSVADLEAMKTARQELQELMETPFQSMQECNVAVPVVPEDTRPRTPEAIEAQRLRNLNTELTWLRKMKEHFPEDYTRYRRAPRHLELEAAKGRGEF